MYELRVFFEKTGRARYISHLDLQRQFIRAFRRSGIRVKYTEGFNPHISMSFALPLAIYAESLCESLDFACEEKLPYSEIVDRLNDVLPPGIRVTRVAPPVMKAKAIFYSDYDVTLSCEGHPAGALLGQWFGFIEQPAIVIAKKTKKGVADVDIKPLFSMLKATSEHEGELLLQLRCRAGSEQNLKPVDLVDAFLSSVGAQDVGVRVLRTAVLTESLEDFR